MSDQTKCPACGAGWPLGEHTHCVIGGCPAMRGEVATSGQKGRMNGAEMIAAERRRQVEEEGMTGEHDDRWAKGQLVDAAVCYLNPRDEVFVAWNWPWGGGWWKPKDELRNLARAGALIAAEIDRLLRQAEQPEEGGDRNEA